MIELLTAHHRRRYDLYDDEYDDGFDAPPLLSFERQSSLDTLGSDSDGDGEGGLPIFANPNHGRNAKTRTVRWEVHIELTLVIRR